MSRLRFMQIAVAFQGGLLIAAYLLGWLIGTPFWQHFHFTWTATLIAVAATLPLVALVIAIDRTSWPPLEPVREDFQRVIQYFRGCTVLDAAILSALAGLGEEALFRGVLQAFITGHTHPAIAIAVAAAVFGAFHLISPGYAIGAALIGAYLGALYHWTGNLLVPALVHGLYDFVLIVYALKVTLKQSQPASTRLQP